MPVLVVILASYLMIVLDISIVITALPKTHTAPGFSATCCCSAHGSALTSTT